MSELKVNKISPRSGTDITLGDSGDTFTLGSGANIAGLTLSDNILFDTASKGIYLGVTTATASNLLDDYEEGTFTPNFSAGITSLGYATRSGSYVKIGTTVFFHLQMVTNAGFGASTRLKIGGLPFTASTSGSGIANINYADNGFINSTSTNFPSLFFETSTIDFYKTNGTDFQGVELADPDSVNIYIGGVYRTG